MATASRSKNATRNIAFAFLKGILNTVLPFITRTIILYLIGTEYLGVGTLFTSILSVLNLSELGLSAAINYSMYKPIVEDDTATINALLRYYRRLYRIIGIVMLGVGSAIVPLLPVLIKGEPPADLNIVILYFLYLINLVTSYFFAGYRQCLLTSHQRSDIVSKITLTAYVINNVLQIIVLVATRNYYVYAAAPIVGTIFTNVCDLLVTKRMYPEISCKGELDPEIRKGIRKRISGLFGTKLNSIVVHQADILVISAFLGLELVTIYGNYYYLFNSVCAFTLIFFSSLTAGVGNKLVLDSIEENVKLFKNIRFLNVWLVGFCGACFMGLYQPFMRLWVGSDLMLPLPFVILLVVYFYIYEVQRTVLTFKDAAGLWYEDRFRPYVTMAFNIVSNLIMVQFIGIYGIVLSSILAFAISLPWANRVLYVHLFKKNPSENLIALGKYTLVVAAIIAASYGICMLLPEGIIGLILRFIVILVFFNGAFFLFYRNKPEFAFVKRYFGKMMRKLRGKK